MRHDSHPVSRDIENIIAEYALYSSNLVVLLN